MKNLILVWWQSLEERPVLWLIIILVISFGLRLTVLATAENIPGEETRREEMSRESLEFGQLTYCNNYFPFCEEGDPSASVAPVPILVFMAFMGLFHNSGLQLIVLLQMALDLITVVLTYKISMHMFGNRQGALLAALLWGIYLPAIAVIEIRLEAEAFFTCFVAAGLLAYLTGLSNKRFRYWIIAGIFFGLATLSREAFLYFPPILVFFTIIRSWRQWRQHLAQSGLLLATFVLVLSPWIIRNALIFQAFVPGSTLTGYNMYRYNHLIMSDERQPPDVVLQEILPFLSEDQVANLINNYNINPSLPVYFRNVSNTEMERVIEQLLTQPGFARGNENEVETDHLFRQATLKLIKEQPDRYLLLSAYRLIPLWTNLSREDGGLSESTWRLIGLVNIVLLLLGTMTLIRLRRNILSPVILPILLLIGYFTLGHILVHARFRFVIPLIPYVMIFAAAQCVYWAGKIYTKKST